MNKEKNTHSDDWVLAENARLRYKLRTLNCRLRQKPSVLSPRIENIFLNHLLRTQQLDCRPERITIRAYLGFPSIKKPEKLKPDEVYSELDRLLTILEKNGVLLTFCEDAYQPDEIYEFIVFQLLDEEVDDFHMKGIVHTFLYEDYYPNPEFDLSQSAEGFVSDLMVWTWKPEYVTDTFSDTVNFNGTRYGYNGINAIILNFKHRYEFVDIEAFAINIIEYDLDTHHGKVTATIRYTTHVDSQHRTYQGPCTFGFVQEFGCWFINSFRLPGFGDEFEQ